MAQYLPVRERCLQELHRQLKTINEDNGYSTPVRSVERVRKIPTEHTSPPQIYVMPDQSTVFHRSTHHKFERCPVDLWLVTQSVHEPDTVFNIFVADVQKLVACGVMTDPTYPVADRAHFDVIADTLQPLYTEAEEGIVYGYLRYFLQYSYLIHDPFKWDDTDVLVERGS